MTTCREIVRAGLVKAGEIAANQRPDGPEENAAMASLQAMIEHWATSGMLGALTDTLISADAEAGEFQRITSTENVTVTLPVMVLDYDEERTPRDGAVVEVALGDPHEVYIYSARIADWQRLDELTLDTDCPLSGRGADGLAACLAQYLASDPGREWSEQLLRHAGQFRSSLAGRWGDARPIFAGTYF